MAESVEWFNASKGFGFVELDTGDEVSFGDKLRAGSTSETYDAGTTDLQADVEGTQQADLDLDGVDDVGLWVPLSPSGAYDVTATLQDDDGMVLFGGSGIDDDYILS